MPTKFNFIWVLFLVNIFSASVFCQSWSSTNVPRFRHVNDIILLPNYRSVAVGGNETNDAITGIFLSEDSSKNWTLISDVPLYPWLTSVCFMTELTGIAAGDAGMVKKTTDGGHSWNTLSLPGNASGRNYKSVFFTDQSTGYLIGGKRTKDSIQTILKTSNGGTSWDIQRDQPGSWLRSSYFINGQTGFVIGDRGTVLKTDNGGAAWSPITLPGSTAGRQLNSIFFTDALTGFIVGGNPSNDSIQTILRTTDGGNNWEIIKDALGPMLNDVHFPTTIEGYAVGDYGSVLKTSDGGATWEKVVISPSINDARSLKTVYFYNRFYGVAAGQSGKILIYFDKTGKTPAIEELPVRLVSQGSVELKAILHPNTLPTSVKLEYGTSPAFGSTVLLDQNVGGDSPVLIFHSLSGLDPSALYYCRFECQNEVGISNSKVFTFYPGYAIPNWDFELWDSTSVAKLNNWQITSTLKKIDLGNGQTAVEIVADAKGPGAIIYGDYKNGKFIGGIPYTEKPDSVVGSFRYQIAAEDTAKILLILKKDGVTITDSMYSIAGSSDNKFERLAYKIPYHESVSPDSLILIIISTNFLAGKLDINSVLAIDSVGFTGTTAQVPNNSFENWTEDTHFEAINWISSDSGKTQQESYCTTRTLDNFAGTYALKLSNVHSSKSNFVGSIRSSVDYNKPSFPVNTRHQFLNCFIKFFPDGIDTLIINVIMYKAGVQIGYGYSKIDSTINTFSSISIPIIYNTQEVPDSAFIMFMLGTTDKGSYNSYALIDALTFDAVSVNVYKPYSNSHLRIYPNPAKDVCTVQCDIPYGLTPILMIYDLTGCLVKQIDCSSVSGKNYTFYLPEMKNGLYIGSLVDSKNHQRLTNSFKIFLIY